MTDLRIITCRGIGESMTENLLSRVVAHFPNTEHVELPWEATYGAVGGNLLGRSFAQATEWGENLLLMELDKGPALVFGYSGGAELAGNVAYRGHPHLIGTGLVADPSSPRMTDNDKFGIRGERGAVYKSEVTWIGNEDDVICSCPEDSPLRAFAQASEGFSLADPEFFTRSVLKQLTTEEFGKKLLHPFSFKETAEAYGQAYVDACLYLGLNPQSPTLRGRCAHTDYTAQLDDLAWWGARQKYKYDSQKALFA